MNVATEPLMAGSIIDEQVKLETQAVREGVKRYHRLARDAVERGDGSALKPAERLMLHWFDVVCEAVKQSKRVARRKGVGPHMAVVGPMLLHLDNQRLAFIAMSRTLSLCMAEPDGVTVSRVANDIGRAVQSEIYHGLLKRDHREALKELEKRTKRMNPMRMNWWAKRTLDDPEFSVSVNAKVGGHLLKLVADTASTARYDGEFSPAFTIDTRREKRKTVAYVRLTDKAIDIIDQGHKTRSMLHPMYLPMVVPPFPWVQGEDGTFVRGGYVRHNPPFIAKATPGQDEALRSRDMTTICDCRTALESTPWRVNLPIMAVVEQLWHAGGEYAGIPRRDKIPVPPRPAAADHDEEIDKDWRRDASAAHSANVALKGVRKLFAQKIDIARQFADRQAMWMPHKFDFRGRVYPIPQPLNHQGDDVCRGMLEFANGVPPESRWLMIHMANCCGVDKVSFDARIHWARDNLATFKGWISDPIENTGWMEADKPFQALAAAYAVDDEQTAEHLPIQLDGSCNGLQHYAAMLGDRHSAEGVNLVAADMPHDTYAAVAERAAEKVAADAEAAVPMAAELAPYVNRDTVKQVVMTNTYGVTMVGARKQIYAKLEKAGFHWEQELYKASMYLSRLVLDCTGDVSPATTAAMEWLQRVATIIARAGKAVAWTTPLGFPVVQPYRRPQSVNVNTILQKITTAYTDDTAPVRVGKQAQAFAPNFVHSIDSTHMLMVARRCRDEGIDFGAVHDSFWCHAGNATRMALILRETFAELHREPLLARLHAELCDRHPTLDLPEPPHTGDYDVSEILDAPYAFQ